MNFTLRDFDKKSVFKIDGHVLRKGEKIDLQIKILGPLKELQIPNLNHSKNFRDGIWEHTCFELFYKKENETPYAEFNFSPCGDYACYFFSHHRYRIDYDKRLPHPPFSFFKDEESLSMNLALELPPSLLGITSVLLLKNGQKEYFALGHPKEKPDFHDSDSFVLKI